MQRWVDVNERDWFFNEIMEASSIVLEDGKPFVESLGYNAYEEGKPYIYEEQDGVEGKTTFTLSLKITPTGENPLYVYIDGIQTIYREVRDNASGTSDVEFYAAPPAGCIVSFGSIGVPVTDRFGKPSFSGPAVAHPYHALDYGATYYYEPFSRQYQEYLYAFGRALKRVSPPDEEWDVSTYEGMADKYIGEKQDVYIVSPAKHGGVIYMPYNLNGVTCKFTYNSMEDGVITMRGGEFRATAPNVLFNNRFFPNALITRAEAFTLIDRLRKTFYSRFTDQDAPSTNFEEMYVAYESQRVFNLDNHYTPGANEIEVTAGGSPASVGVDYTEFDDHTILWNTPVPQGLIIVVRSKITGSKFADVGTNTKMYNADDAVLVDVTGTVGTWWADSVMAMEREKFGNGDYLIQGITINNFDGSGNPVVDRMYNPLNNSLPDLPHADYFLPLSLLTRSQSAAFLNRFRKWCIERFK